MAVKFGRYRWLGYMIVVLTMVVIGIPALLVGLQLGKQRTGQRGWGTGEVADFREGDHFPSFGAVFDRCCGCRMPVSFHEEAFKGTGGSAASLFPAAHGQGKEDDQHPDAHLCADPATGMDQQ